MTEKTSKPQFYKNVVPLSATRHAKFCIKPAEGYHYAKDTNAVLITQVEFPLAAREYPIVFVEEGDNINPAVVLGLQQNHNQFLNKDGSWGAGYVPAYVRRYPFIAGRTGDKEDEITVCIDEAAANFNTTEGEALFTASGEPTDFLKKSIEFIKEFQVHTVSTAKFSKRLKKLGLFSPVRADAQIKGGAKASLTGFMVVDRTRLKGLSGKNIVELLKADELELIYLHLASLSNFQRLVDAMAKQS